MAREREVEDTDGRVYTMWVRPYRTSDNRIDGVVLAWVDVTERKRAVEARYRRLFETAKDGIVIVDDETGEIVDSNPFIAKLLGFSRTRLLGKKFWEAELFADSEINHSILSALHEHESVHRTVRLLSEAGERVPVDIVASLYAEGDRKVIQFNIRDVTARHRVEQRMQRDEEQLRQSEKMEAVGRLAGGVAHEFNNLLTSVLGYTNLLSRNLEPNHPVRPWIKELREAGERAVVLTKQLLAFGRKNTARSAILNPNEIVGDMRQLLTVMLRDGIELELKLAPDVANVKVDRSQIEQVVLNLVLNARDAIAEAGTIRISTANEEVDKQFTERHPSVPVGRFVRITVEDTGSGMDDETQEHLFQPFFTSKPKGTGAGLGLATVYNIVKQNDGYVSAYSELGVGSVFTVFLPRVAQQPEPAAVEASAESLPQATETVLFVENELPLRKLLRRFLESAGYQVLEASGGPEALRVSREHSGPIHVLLTDVVMPRMSGREVALQLQLKRPDMKVMYISGHTEEAIADHGVLEDGVAFLPKPFSQQVLLSRVRWLLDGSETENKSPQQGQSNEN